MKRKRDSIASFLFFLIYPFLGFVLSIKDLRKWSNGIVFILFSALWGYSMTFTYTPSDCYRIAAVFCQRPFFSIDSILEQYDDGKLVDFYLAITNLFVHQFSPNAKVFFCLLGFFFGLCCYATIRQLILSRKGPNDQYLKCIVFLLFSTASFGHLAMPRFWTAAWLSAFLLIKLIKGQYYWFPLIILLPLIHFGFVPIAVALASSIFFSKFFSKYEPTLFGFVVFCFIISFVLNSEILGHIIPTEWVSGEKATSKYNSYVDSGIASEHGVVKERSAYRVANGYVTTLFQIIMKCAAMAAISIIHNHKEWVRNNKGLWNCYIFILLMASACFFMGVVRGVGWRYTWTLWMPLYYFIYRIYDSNRTIKLKRLIIGLIPVNIYTISFMFYVSYRNVDWRLFFYPLYNLIVNGFDFPPVDFV